MNKSRKIDLLYKKAHGQGVDMSPGEKRELSKYKVQAGDSNYATRANISKYVSAVDGGYRLSFYDWCLNNHKADRRRKGSSEREMARENTERGIGAVMLGWLVWGIAIYWIFNERLSVGSCAIAGAIVSLILSRVNRRLSGLTVFILPIVLVAIWVYIFGK